MAYSADGVATLAQVDVNGQLVNTELPAAAALSDTIANPTSPMVGAGGMVWDGAQWTRQRQVGSGVGATPITGIAAVGQYVLDPTSTYRVVCSPETLGDGSPGIYFPAVGPYMYNGATNDRMRGDTTNGLDVDVTRLPALVAGSAAIGKLAANSGVDIGDVDVTSLPVPPRPATATLANVAGSASSVTLQASNTARQGWTVWNDSTSILYLKFGSSASATSATVKLASDDYYELAQPCYTGIITGIWVAAVGSARVTEVTA